MSALAGNIEALEYINVKGCSMNQKNNDVSLYFRLNSYILKGDTPLHLAIMTKQAGTIVWLLEHGAKSDIRNNVCFLRERILKLN